MKKTTSIAIFLTLFIFGVNSTVYAQMSIDVSFDFQDLDVQRKK